VTGVARSREDARFRQAVESAPNAMVMIDEAGVIELVNSETEQTFGYARDELLGQSIEILIPARFRAHHPGLRGGFFTSPQARPMGVGRDLFGLRKDGSELPVEIALRPIQTEEGPKVISAIVDITERKLSQQKLVGALADAERAQRALAASEADLRIAKNRAEAAAEAKSDFLANMSHELRTPLTAIIGFAGILRAKGKLGDVESKYLRRIDIASRNLLMLVNNVLDMSKVEAGEMQLERRPTDIRALTGDIVLMLEGQSKAKGLKLKIVVEREVPRLILADPGRLTQILSNLVGNAIKFTAKGGVSLRVLPAFGHRLRFEVKDTGEGIPAERTASLFDRFVQADSSTTRKHGGTGLGLAICKGLVELMDGRIAVESVEGTGSTFWFEIPLQVVTGRAARQSA
jgi:protein-histidine pros-kinase